MEASGLNLLMTTDAVGGIWTYALDLAGALRHRGVTVTLALVGPALDAAKREAVAETGLALVDLGHPPEWLASGPAAVARGGAALAALAEDLRADVIHLNHPALAPAAPTERSIVAVCHSCVATWWSAVRGGALPDDLAWQARLVGAGYRAAATLVAPSRAFAVATGAAYALPRLPKVVPNGRAAWSERAADVVPPPGALTAGRLWDEGKDVATLDAAAARTAVPIRAAGPLTGPNGAFVAPPHLQALGALPEARLRALLAERPIYVTAARYEPFGLSVLEAAQAGCALVLSDIATFRELWDEAALFVAPGDSRGFAAALDRLIAEPALRGRLGEAARDRSRRYTIETQTDSMLAIYRTLTGPVEQRQAAVAR